MCVRDNHNLTEFFSSVVFDELRDHECSLLKITSLTLRVQQIHVSGYRSFLDMMDLQKISAHQDVCDWRCETRDDAESKVNVIPNRAESANKCVALRDI